MSADSQLVFRSPMPVSAAEVFAWHARPGAFERLVAPWERIRVRARSGGIRDGARITMDLRRWPLWLRWEGVHDSYQEGGQFRDIQIKGPFARWEHTHRFLDAPEGGSAQPPASILEDHIDYRLPLPARMVAGSIRRSLERTFAFRHERTRNDLQRHAALTPATPWRIAITGASGVVGRQLVAYLTTAGHEVVTLVRRPAQPGEITWDPAKGQLDAGALEGIDAVVHLAGENLANGRWSEAQKKLFIDSRRQGTQLIASTMARLDRRPKVLISASAVGYYGDRPDEVVHEDSPPGRGFLAEICQVWEEATQAAVDAGIRVVPLRIGVVLTASGGALPKLLTPFRMGMGGPIGSGQQGLPWIGLDDLLAVIEHALFTDTLHGPVNAVAPETPRQREFARALGRVLHRPSFMPLPAAVVRLVFGEMGQHVLLEGAHVEPRRLKESGFELLRPRLEDALAFELGRAAADY